MNQAFATFGKRKAPKGAMNRGGRRSPDGSPGPGDGGGAMSGAVGGALDVSQSDEFQTETYASIAFDFITYFLTAYAGADNADLGQMSHIIRTLLTN